MLATVSGRQVRRLSGLHSGARFVPRTLGQAAGAAVGAASLTTGLVTAGIGAAVSLAASGVTDWLNSIQLSHQADSATTAIVNGLEPLLRANVAAFQSGPQTQCSQQVSLAAFDTAWQWLISSAGCGNGAYGSAGGACISDRNRGGKWDWFSYYRDPIAYAATTPDTACPGTTVSGSGQTTDLQNDLAAMLPGSGGQYLALLQASGTAPGVISSGSPAAGGSAAAVAGGLSQQQLIILAAVAVAAVVLLS